MNARHGREVWSATDLQCLHQWYATQNTVLIAQALGKTVAQVHAKANKLGLKKSRDLIAAEAKANLAKPGHGAQAKRFLPGHVPVNKGVKGWQAGGRSVDTQFRPGNKPHTWMPVGSYRINKGDGALERKTNDLPGANHVRWRPVARLVWEEANGPVPAGHLVVFRPGRRTTELDLITLDAVELVDKAEHCRRNSIHRLPPEFAEVARLRAQLARAINRKARAEQAPGQKEAATS